MKKTKVIIILLMILSIFITFNTTCLAEGISYYTSGNIRKIETQNVVIEYYSFATIRMISINNKDVVIKYYSSGNLNNISTPSGDIYFYSYGDIENVYGNWNNIYKEVEDALKLANSEIISYITSVNIQIPGTSTPSESADEITESLNEIIDDLNSYSTYITTNNSNSDNGINNGENQQANINENQINVGDKDSQVQIGQNGINISTGSDSDSLSIGESGLNINDGNTQVQIGANGLYIGDDKGVVSIGEDGLVITQGNETTIGGGLAGLVSGVLDPNSAFYTDTQANVDKQPTSIWFYVTIALLFFIAFIALIFGIYKIKKKKGQVVVK